MSVAHCHAAITIVQVRESEREKRENSWKIGGKRGLRMLVELMLSSRWSRRAIRKGEQRERVEKRQERSRIANVRNKETKDTLESNTHHWISIVIILLLKFYDIINKISPTLFLVLLLWRGKRKSGQERKRKKTPPKYLIIAMEKHGKNI